MRCPLLGADDVEAEQVPSDGALGEGGVLAGAAAGGVRPLAREDGIEIAGGEAAVHRGMPKCPVDVGATTQRR